jgi:hypothetical protein
MALSGALAGTKSNNGSGRGRKCALCSLPYRKMTIVALGSAHRSVSQ